MPEGGGPNRLPKHDAQLRAVNVSDAELDWDNTPTKKQPTNKLYKLPKISIERPQGTVALRKADDLLLSGLVNRDNLELLPIEHTNVPIDTTFEQKSDPTISPLLIRDNEEYEKGRIAEHPEKAIDRRRFERSHSVSRVTSDIQEIIGIRDANSAGYENMRFGRQSADVFFRLESMAIATSQEIWRIHYWKNQQDRITRSENLLENHLVDNKIIARVFSGDLLPSRPENMEDEMIIVAELEFELLIGELKELQANGAQEDVVFKKILEQVNAFPYRQTANSLLKAFAGRSREHSRTKRGFLVELARANELPGLNCEGRAKMFAGLLEAIGYDPMDDIFVNWPKNHVQILLKQKDGTWLAFEGSNRRPFIQTFAGQTAGVCTLQEWKETLYGLPSADMIASVKPEIKVIQKSSDEKGEPAWKEGGLEKVISNALDVVKDVASVSVAGIVGAFAGKPNEEEHIKSAYPVFEVKEGATDNKANGLKESPQVNNVAHGHIDSLRKILAPRIAATKRIFSAEVGVAGTAIAAIAAGCWFANGAANASESNSNTLATADEVKKERDEWQELTQAAFHEVAIDSSLAPYVFSEFDLVGKTQEGEIEQRDENGVTIHTIRLADSVRTMSPGVFESMVIKDISQRVEGGHNTVSRWAISGKNLDVHAAQSSIADLPKKGEFIVSDLAGSEINLDHNQTLNITWQLTSDDENEQIELVFNASDNGPTDVRGPAFADDYSWTYTMRDKDVSVLATIHQIEDIVLYTQYGLSGWQAPLRDIK